MVIIWGCMGFGSLPGIGEANGKGHGNRCVYRGLRDSSARSLIIISTGRSNLQRENNSGIVQRLCRVTCTGF